MNAGAGRAALDVFGRPDYLLAMALVLVEGIVALGLHEIGQHVAGAPADISEIAPTVVVGILAADDDEAVDRRRPAQDPAARPVDATAAHGGFGLGLETPVDPVVPHRLAVADGQMDPEALVAGAGLDERDPVASALAETVRQHATGRAGADDNEIEFR